MKEETLTLPEETGEEDLPEAEMLDGLDELAREEMEACGELVREMSPEERRQYCADMEAAKTEAVRKALGRAFNAVAGAGRKRAPEGRELGERIMAERSANAGRKE